MTTDRNKTVIAEGRFVNFARYGTWEFVERRDITGIICVVPVTSAREILFVEQFRPPVQANVMELPAGLAGDEADSRDEHLAEAARRELLEETGYHADRMTWISRGPLTPGVSSEVVDFYLATSLRRIHDGGGVSEEEIVVHAVALEKAHEWLRERLANGVLIDPKCYMGLYFAERAGLSPHPAS